MFYVLKAPETGKLPHLSDTLFYFTRYNKNKLQVHVSMRVMTLSQNKEEEIITFTEESCLYHCWAEPEPRLLQNHLTRVWMPIASNPITDKKQMLVVVLWPVEKRLYTDVILIYLLAIYSIIKGYEALIFSVNVSGRTEWLLLIHHVLWLYVKIII